MQYSLPRSRKNDGLILIMLMLVLILAKPISSTAQTVTTHDHSRWSIALYPIMFGKLGLHSESITEYGIAAGLHTALSRTVSFNLTTSLGFGDAGDESNRSFTVTAGPRYMLQLSQRDRFFVGLSGNLFATTERGGDTHWGGGPEVLLGVDYAVSRRACALIEITAGLAGVDAENQSDVVGYNVVGWGRARLGLRLPI